MIFIRMPVIENREGAEEGGPRRGHRLKSLCYLAGGYKENILGTLPFS